MSRLNAPGLAMLAFALAMPAGLTARQTAGTPGARDSETTTGQQTAEALRERLDELRPLLAKAQEEASDREARDNRAWRESAAAAATVDTFQVELVRVIAPVDQVEEARELFTEVWNESYSLITTSPSLEEATFSFQWSDERVPIHIESDPRLIELKRSWVLRPNVKRAIRNAIAGTINYDLRRQNARVSSWVQGNPIQTPDMERTYRQVATTHSRITRACLLGDTYACKSAMGLTFSPPPYPFGPVDDGEVERWENQLVEQMTEWYTPDERRSLVAGVRRLPGRQDASAWSDCVEDRVISACDQLLSAGYSDVSPLRGAVRETLAAYAIEQGGQGAWGRLIEDPEMEPVVALEYASAMPIDDLVAGWRDRLIANRPQSFEGLWSGAGLAVLWFLFFSTLAMRSTRWRFG